MLNATLYLAIGEQGQQPSVRSAAASKVGCEMSASCPALRRPLPPTRSTLSAITAVASPYHPHACPLPPLPNSVPPPPSPSNSALAHSIATQPSNPPLPLDGCSPFHAPFSGRAGRFPPATSQPPQPSPAHSSLLSHPPSFWVPSQCGSRYGRRWPDLAPNGGRGAEGCGG